MSIERVATSTQNYLLLSQIAKANDALNTDQQQIASGKVSTTYAGMGDKTAVLEAARSAAGRVASYQPGTQLALTQANLQDTQLSSLSDIANQLRQALTEAVGTGDGSTLGTQLQDLMDQITQVLNSKDSNGNYLYGGDKNNVPPVTVSSLSDLAGLAGASDAFQNGTIAQSVQVADGETVGVGVLASDVGSGLMQTLKSIADYVQSNGDFGTSLSQSQADFLTSAISGASTAATQVNNAAAANGYTVQRLSDASDQQDSLSTLYTGFVSNLEDVDMGQAVTKLNQDQVALQAALQMTSQLSQVSLLNYMGTSPVG